MAEYDAQNSSSTSVVLTLLSNTMYKRRNLEYIVVDSERKGRRAVKRAMRLITEPSTS